MHLALYLSLFLLLLVLLIPINSTILFKKTKTEETFLIKLCITPRFFGKNPCLTIIKINPDKILARFNFLAKNQTNYTESLTLKFFKILAYLLVRTLTNNKKLLRVISCDKLVWKTNFGVGEPALTAIVAGNLWLLKTIVYLRLMHSIKLNFKRPIYVVHPDFTNKVFEVDFSCIFRFRIGDIIVAGLFKSFLAQRGWK